MRMAARISDLACSAHSSSSLKSWINFTPLCSCSAPGRWGSASVGHLLEERSSSSVCAIASRRSSPKPDQWAGDATKVAPPAQRNYFRAGLLPRPPPDFSPVLLGPFSRLVFVIIWISMSREMDELRRPGTPPGGAQIVGLSGGLAGLGRVGGIRVAIRD